MRYHQSYHDQEKSESRGEDEWEVISRASDDGGDLSEDDFVILVSLSCMVNLSLL